MHNNNHKRQDTNIFPRGNHKGENPANSSELEWAPIAKVKTKDTKMISDSCSLSHLCELLLSHSCATVEWVCVSNREWDSLCVTHTHSRIAYEWERSSMHKWERTTVGDHLCIFDFYFFFWCSFYLWGSCDVFFFMVSLRKVLCLLSLVIIVVHVIISDKILDHID